MICDADSPKLPDVVTVFKKSPKMFKRSSSLRLAVNVQGIHFCLTHKLSVGVVFLVKLVSK